MAYEEPTGYQPHDSTTCVFCKDKRPEPGQTGVFGLLEGERLLIKPDGFDAVHSREDAES